MSNYEPFPVAEREQPPPSLEPWLLMCLLALIPGLLIVVLPPERLVPLLVPVIGSMVVLLVIGLVMLWRTERERRPKGRERRDGREAADTLDLRQREA